MKRAAVAVAVMAALILLLALKAPAWVTITGAAVALLGVGVGGSVRWIYRHGMVVQWGKIPLAQTCKRCGGWGVLDKNKQPYHQDPRTMAHVMWAAGNRRSCPDCQGRGYFSPRRAASKMPGPTVHLVPADPPDGLVYPDGPDGPPAIDPTRIIPPGWSNGGKR